MSSTTTTEPIHEQEPAQNCSEPTPSGFANNNSSDNQSVSDAASPPQRTETASDFQSPVPSAAPNSSTFDHDEQQQTTQQQQQPPSAAAVASTSTVPSPPPALQSLQVPVPQRQSSIVLHANSSNANNTNNAPARVKQPNYNRGEQTHSTIAELSEAFRMFTNVNGIVPQSVITPKDLAAVLQQTGSQKSDREVATLIQTIDQSSGGNISFDEFASLMGRSVHIDEVDSLQAAFQAIDKNGTGIVTSAAFAELMACYGEHSDAEEVSEMLAFADPNNTGKVNYRVFLRMLGLRLR